MSDLLSIFAASLAGLGLVQALAGWLALRQFRRWPPHVASALPPVTVLKPLHGDEPLLEEALDSFYRQDYPDFQIVFGLQNGSDPALAVVQRLTARYPNVHTDVIVDGTPHGANRKIANLINMYPAARHDVLVITDSDIHVVPGYLRELVSALEGPDVGLVTTVYTALFDARSLPGQLGAAYVTQNFLPGALMARVLGRRDCLGATMALRRSTLERVGGLLALSDQLADDAVLGRLVRSLGLSVTLAAALPATTIPETTLRRLFLHELRWARTIRTLAPIGFVLSVLQLPLVWAVLAVAISAARGWSLEAFVAVWALRALIGRGVDRTAGSKQPMPVWLWPIRDLLSVTVMIASYTGRTIAWRGETLRMSPETVLRPPRRRLAPGQGISLR